MTNEIITQIMVMRNMDCTVNVCARNPASNDAANPPAHPMPMVMPNTRPRRVLGVFDNMTSRITG